MTVTHKKNLKPATIYYAFFISGVFNIVLVLGFIYLHYFGQPTFAVKTKGEDKAVCSYALLTPSMEVVLREYAQMPYDALCKEVHKLAHVEQGFCRSDLALAILVGLHRVDIKRALGQGSLERRTYAFSPTGSEEAIELSLYPGIKGEKLHQIQQFLSQETYPFTSCGLFEKIALLGSEAPSGLVQNFTMSDEFESLHLAMSRARVPVPKEVLVSLVFEGSWELFDRYSHLSRRDPKAFLKELGPLLQEYVASGSSMAAYLAILLEKEYVLKQFDDVLLTELLNTIEPKNPEMKAFLKDVIISMRCEEIRTLASQKLGGGGRAALTSSEQSFTIVKTDEYVMHVIKEGETLWGLSRAYGIDIETIKGVNNLSNSVLIPGRELKIPKK